MTQHRPRKRSDQKIRPTAPRKRWRGDTRAHGPTLVLPPRSADLVASGHAWVTLEQASHPLEEAPGSVISLLGPDGTWLARALYCPGEPIAARVITRDPQETCDAALFRARTMAALDLRERLAIDATQYRLVNAEGDGLPGITADRYGDYLVVQLTTVAASRLVSPVVTACLDRYPFHGVFLKHLPRDRRAPDLPPGRWLDGAPGPEELVTREGALQFVVRPFSALSTGVFLDQRDNRRVLAGLTPRLRVLNTFAYTGGFSVACARNGAQVDTLDISRRALAWAQENFRLNGLTVDPARFIREDAFRWLRRRPEAYDAIILDPPAFSTSKRGVWEPRRMAELQEAAFNAVRPGGFVATFTNMRKLSARAFLEKVVTGAQRAGRRVSVLARLQAGMDFPWDLGTPETSYLKGLLVKVG